MTHPLCSLHVLIQVRFSYVITMKCNRQLSVWGCDVRLDFEHNNLACHHSYIIDLSYSNVVINGICYFSWKA